MQMMRGAGLSRYTRHSYNRATFTHQRRQSLQYIECAAQVNPDDLVPFVGCYFIPWSNNVLTGAQNQYIEAAESGFELLGSGCDRAWITDIHLAQPGSTAFRLDKSNCVAGAGVSVQEVNQLLSQFEQTQKMMKMVAKGGMQKMMRGMKGMRPRLR